MTLVWQSLFRTHSAFAPVSNGFSAIHSRYVAGVRQFRARGHCSGAPAAPENGSGGDKYADFAIRVEHAHAYRTQSANARSAQPRHQFLWTHQQALEIAADHTSVADQQHGFGKTGRGKSGLDGSRVHFCFSIGRLVSRKFFSHQHCRHELARCVPRP